MFEKATRAKLRFESPQGNLSVEDLWDLPLISNNGKVASLDDIAKNLYKKIKNDEIKSFVIKDKTMDTTLQLKFDIVKHVIDVRCKEVEANELAKSNKEKKQRILAIIANKENEQLAGASLEELRQMAESL